MFYSYGMALSSVPVPPLAGSVGFEYYRLSASGKFSTVELPAVYHTRTTLTVYMPLLAFFGTVLGVE